MNEISKKALAFLVGTSSKVSVLHGVYLFAWMIGCIYINIIHGVFA